MEKILLVLDPQHMTTQTIDFACYIACLTHSTLTGVFMGDREDSGPLGLGFAASDGTAQALIDTVNWTREGGLSHDKGKVVLENCCDARGTRINVAERGIGSVDDMVAASRFADILIIDTEASFEPETAAPSHPHKLLRELLQRSECPVIVAPYSFEGIEEIIFTYDGSNSAVYAIKQFSYLFPCWRNKKVILLEVNKGIDQAIFEQHKMKEWLEAHYEQVSVNILSGDASTELFGYLIGRKDGIVVMGAYGRNWLSRLFRPSHAGLIVKAVNLPVFITHQ